jgi:Haemolymph juvenile hormone binding protein (JHBP)
MLIEGIPSIDLPSIEPMKIKSVSADQLGATTAFNLRSSFKNAEIHGLSRSRVVKTVVKFKKFGMKSDAYTERLDFVGHYKMQGQILVLPIVGEGFANVSMQQLTTRHEMLGEYYTGDDGNTYANITSYKIKFTPKRVSFRFDNLFNGDKTLGETMIRFMNENWEPVFYGLIPPYEDKFGEKFRSVANILFHQVPFKLVFLE